MLKKLVFIFAMSIFIFLSKPSNVMGQIVSSDNNCENNISLLVNIKTPTKKESSVIVIAYQGKKESSARYSLGRLNKIKRILGDKNIVFAIGERLVTKPKVEIYINGKIELILETKNREMLRAGNCDN